MSAGNALRLDYRRQRRVAVSDELIPQVLRERLRGLFRAHFPTNLRVLDCVWRLSSDLTELSDVSYVR